MKNEIIFRYYIIINKLNNIENIVQRKKLVFYSLKNKIVTKNSYYFYFLLLNFAYFKIDINFCIQNFIPKFYFF
jgi:hypothetical protein